MRLRKDLSSGKGPFFWNSPVFCTSRDTKIPLETCQFTLNPWAGGLRQSLMYALRQKRIPSTSPSNTGSSISYNDWFNKHEGDWEMIQLTTLHSYLSPG